MPVCEDVAKLLSGPAGQQCVFAGRSQDWPGRVCWLFLFFVYTSPTPGDACWIQLQPSNRRVTVLLRVTWIPEKWHLGDEPKSPWSHSAALTKYAL
jgi:hypothetical protein